MNILAVESASDTLHIALQTPEQYISHTHTIGRKFSEELVPRMKALCEEAHIRLKDLSLVVCSNGPGSFTGLRVGMSAAKGIALAADIPLVSLSTMEIHAFPLRHAGIPVLCVLDAKKHRFYGALFDHGNRIVKDTDATIGMMADMVAPYPAVLLAGPDASRALPLLGDEVTKRGLHTKLLLDELKFRDYGESMIILGRNLLDQSGPDDIASGPTYIRKSDAEVSLEEKLNLVSER